MPYQLHRLYSIEYEVIVSDEFKKLWEENTLVFDLEVFKKSKRFDP
jgi:hypothetical protein